MFISPFKREDFHRNEITGLFVDDCIYDFLHGHQIQE